MSAESSQRVLVVDDNELNLELAQCVLEAGGFAVDRAINADAARASLREHRPDLILMDIQMPGTDGLTLTRELKADPTWREIPVVAFTAYAMPGDEERCRAAGCEGYLTKPIDVRCFAGQVGAFLGAAA